MGRVIAYIDGFNLYFGLRAAGLRRFYWLDLVALAENLLRPGQALEGVHYFTARLRDDGTNRADISRQSQYLDALDTRRHLTRHEGHFLEKRRKCRSCGTSWTTYEEKMSDVNFAVQLLVDAIEDRYDVALLLTGDSDLATPIRQVLGRFPNKRVVVAFPPRRKSVALQGVASGFLHIGEDKLRRSLLPDSLWTSNGQLLERPRTWH